MAEFTPGQRVTASQLNNLFDNATEGNHSNTSIVNGKIINNPIGLQYKELYSAPRFLDIKYCCSNYRFEGEDDNINQHTYINIIDAENQWIRTDGYYYEYERDKTRWVFMYSDGEKAIVRVVTNQDLDINTDLNTRQLDTYVKNYEPKTTYSGYIETPIPPETNIYIAELGLYTESDARVGGIFLIYGNKEQDEFITEPIQAKIIKELNDSGFWKYEGQSQDIDKLLSECGLRLQENNKMPIGSKVLNRYKGNIGVYNIEQEDTNPWTVDNHNNNKIKNPYYQIGVSRFECSAYENGEYQINQLSSVSLSASLSAMLGRNYCVIDVPRLSAYHTWDSKDHPLSDSPNFNPAFQVALEVFEFKETSYGTPQRTGIPWVSVQYKNRYPIAPCWQVYPF